jgi:hypothetical protein
MLDRRQFLAGPICAHEAEGRVRIRGQQKVAKLALAIWLVGPLPLLIVNGLFIKLRFAITASYSLGWLVKLVVAAVAVTLILR